MKHENIAELTAEQQETVKSEALNLVDHLRETGVKDLLLELFTAQQELNYLKGIETEFFDNCDVAGIVQNKKNFPCGIRSLLDDVCALLLELNKLDDIAQATKGID